VHQKTKPLIFNGKKGQRRNDRNGDSKTTTISMSHSDTKNDPVIEEPTLANPDADATKVDELVEEKQTNPDTKSIEAIIEDSIEMVKLESTTTKVDELVEEKQTNPDTNIVTIEMVNLDSTTDIPESDASPRRQSFADSMEDMDDIQHEAYVDWLFCRLSTAVCFDSFPFGCLIGLALTIAGCKYQLDGVFLAQPVLAKYIPDETPTVVLFCVLGATAIITVNTFVLFQGIAIFIIQSQRKCCGHRTLGCHCCNNNCTQTIRDTLAERERIHLQKEGDATLKRKAAKKKAAKRTIEFFKSADKDGDGTISIAEFETFVLSTADKQAAARRSSKLDDEEGIDNRCVRYCCKCIESTWAFFGTVLIWVIYLLGLALCFPSLICYMLTWLLGKSQCH
jgi:hypothetical protein